VSDFDTSSEFRGLPLAVLTLTSGRIADVAGFGGGSAMALPLIPSPSTSDSVVADSGGEWLHETLACNFRTFDALSSDMLTGQHRINAKFTISADTANMT